MSGSSIDLVQKIFSLEPLQAVKKINVDFGLGLDLEIYHQATMIEIQEIERKRELLMAFEHWCNKTYSEYAQIARFYWQKIQEYKPVNEDDELHPLYADACHQWEPVNYILDILFKGTVEEKIALYKDLNKLEVKVG